ncbi:MAG TPA: cupin domain-containing protein [Candidatus Hydrogenedentes bacterium]|jgi:quercetin dioxygenase-like cupin family protein|nr:cupin domain-containing protein [Candidatus Hydrogenedentota bacterium]
MALPHAAPGIPVDLQPETVELSDAKARALVKTDAFEAIRLVVPEGHEVCRNHQVDGPLTIYCLKGQIAFSADDQTHVLSEGHWLFLPGGVPHTVTGMEDSLLLLTIMFC